jgi:hypothetical protein
VAFGYVSPNLDMHRAPRSVWDKRGWRGITIEERVAPWLISMAGACLLVYGAMRRSRRGTPYVIGGAGLIGCAAVGFCNPRYATARWQHLRRRIEPDSVTTESMDSFPASDAPSSNATARQ